MRQPSFRSHRLSLVLGFTIIASLAVPLAAQQAGPPPVPATGGRLMVLFFDVAIMVPDDVRRATAAGVRFVNETMKNADSLAVVTIGTRLSVLKDFTSNREELRTALESPELLNETAPDVGALTRNPISQNADAATSLDVHIRALTTLCQTLAPIQQKKTVLYFTSGMNRTAGAGLAELGAATNACSRANVTVYPLDARGLPALAANQ